NLCSVISCLAPHFSILFTRILHQPTVSVRSFMPLVTREQSHFLESTFFIDINSTCLSRFWVHHDFIRLEFLREELTGGADKPCSDTMVPIRWFADELIRPINNSRIIVIPFFLFITSKWVILEVPDRLIVQQHQTSCCFIFSVDEFFFNFFFIKSTI